MQTCKVFDYGNDTIISKKTMYHQYFNMNPAANKCSLYLPFYSLVYNLKDDYFYNWEIYILTFLIIYVINITVLTYDSDSKTCTSCQLLWPENDST